MAQTLQALFRQDGESLDFTAPAAITGGEVFQLSDGRAAVCPVDVASGAVGAASVEGVYRLKLTDSINILAGGKVYWDHSANKAHFKQANDRDFYVGVAIADVTAGTDQTVDVAINVKPSYEYDMAVDPSTTTLVGSATIGTRGGTTKLSMASTNEAEKADIISKRGFAIASNPILEARIQVVSDGAGTAVDFNVGLASGTHATDFDAIAEFVSIQMDANSTQVNAQSDDGTTDVALVDTTVDVVENTAFEVWIDARTPSSVKIYVDGVRVLTGTTFTLAAGTGPLYAIAHVEKTSSTDTYDVDIDWLRVRLMET